MKKVGDIFESTKLMPHVGSVLDLWKKAKLTALSPLPRQQQNTLELSGHLLLWAAFSSCGQMVQSSAFTTIWPSDCLDTARMSFWERWVRFTSLTKLLKLRIELALNCVTVAFCQQSAAFLMPGFYEWITDPDKKEAPVSDSHVLMGKSPAMSKISANYGEHSFFLWKSTVQCLPYHAALFIHAMHFALWLI